MSTFEDDFAPLSRSGELVPILDSPTRKNLRPVTSSLLVSVEEMKLLQHNCVAVRWGLNIKNQTTESSFKDLIHDYESVNTVNNSH